MKFNILFSILFLICANFVLKISTISTENRQSTNLIEVEEYEPDYVHKYDDKEIDESSPSGLKMEKY